jgi:type I site-specific restriction endonuclease
VVEAKRCSRSPREAESFAANKRRALRVMATGTGKTRVIMA